MRNCALAKSDYYAPIPTLSMDAAGRVVDYNIAMEVLLGSDIIGWRYQSAQLLLDRVKPLLKGNLLPPLDIVQENHPGIHIDDGSCSYYSRVFGKSLLRRTAISHLNPDNGDHLGMTFFWELLQVEREALFREVLEREQKRCLTWETYAISYDRVLPRLPFYREVVERHLAAMSASDIIEILDLGAGTGNVAIPLMQNGRHVTAVDISRAMLDKLRSKLAKGESNNLAIVEQNGQHLPQWRNESFDGATILLALFDMSDPSAALREAMRVLRPGGLLLVTEPKRCFNLQNLLDFSEGFLRDNGLWESLGDDWRRVTRINRVLDPSARFPLFAEDIRGLLEGTGFRELDMQDSHLGNCATIRAIKPR